MAKGKQTEISVTTIFSGKRDGQQAFVELILNKHREMEQKKSLDSGQLRGYNGGKVFSDVRVV